MPNSVHSSILGAGRIASSGGSSGGSTGGGTSYSGQAMPVGNLTGWTQVVAEDFLQDVPIGGFVSNDQGVLQSSGSAYTYYRNRMLTYPDGWDDTDHNALYYPSKTVSVSNSCYDIYLHSESINGTVKALGATVAPLFPNNGYDQTYGRYSYRMRATVNGTNYGAVALLINSNNWPAGGELDWPEGDVSGDIHGFYHYANSGGGQVRVEGQGANWADWHTYTQEWTPSSVKWYVDNTMVLNTSTYVPQSDLPFLLQAGSTGGAPATSTTGHIQIDWMTIYSYTP